MTPTFVYETATGLQNVGGLGAALPAGMVPVRVSGKYSGRATQYRQAYERKRMLMWGAVAAGSIGLLGLTWWLTRPKR